MQIDLIATSIINKFMVRQKTFFGEFTIWRMTFLPKMNYSVNDFFTKNFFTDVNSDSDN